MTLQAKYDELIKDLKTKYPAALVISVTAEGPVLTKVVNNVAITDHLTWQAVDEQIDLYQLAITEVKRSEGPRFDQLGPLLSYINQPFYVKLTYAKHVFTFTKEFLLE